MVVVVVVVYGAHLKCGDPTSLLFLSSAIWII